MYHIFIKYLVRYLPPIFLLSLAITMVGVSVSAQPIATYQKPIIKFWQIQAVDTMKYSRDMARAKLNDSKFDATIDQQIHAIADTGANYVAISTPYDEEFIPILKRWVASARQYGLSVWFRGNFSGWEGWFEYPRINQIQHLRATRAFILEHPELFVDGDIFVACPECENGGPGDPRFNGQVERHRDFLKSLDVVSRQAFDQINKKISTNYFSMNGDVARLIMNVETTNDLNNIVTIDHYVESPRKLAQDINDIANMSQGYVVLGEFGAPIPDIHGEFDDARQAAWLESTLSEIAASPKLIGVNYWVNTGGSTELWDNKGNAHSGVRSLTKFFKPDSIFGVVSDEIGRPIVGAVVKTSYRQTITDKRGYYQLPFLADKNSWLEVSAKGYNTNRITIRNQRTQRNVTLRLSRESLTFKARKLLMLVSGLSPR